MEAATAAFAEASMTTRRQERRSRDGECSVCLDAANSHVLVPCGHKCVCETCAEMIKENEMDCPICRVKVMWVCRVFE